MTPTGDVHPKQEGTDFARVTKYDLLRAALEYATNGRPSFPAAHGMAQYLNHKCEPIDAKAPLTFHGWRRTPPATSDHRSFVVGRRPLRDDRQPRHARPDRLGCRPAKRRRPVEVSRDGQDHGATHHPHGAQWARRRGHHLFFQRPLGQLTDVRIKKRHRPPGRRQPLHHPAAVGAPETGGAVPWRGVPTNRQRPCLPRWPSYWYRSRWRPARLPRSAKEPTGGKLAEICAGV